MKTLSSKPYWMLAGMLILMQIKIKALRSVFSAVFLVLPSHIYRHQSSLFINSWENLLNMCRLILLNTTERPEKLKQVMRL